MCRFLSKTLYPSWPPRYTIFWLLQSFRVHIGYFTNRKIFFLVRVRLAQLHPYVLSPSMSSCLRKDKEMWNLLRASSAIVAKQSEKNTQNDITPVRNLVKRVSKTLVHMSFQTLWATISIWGNRSILTSKQYDGSTYWEKRFGKIVQCQNATMFFVSVKLT